MSSSLDEGQLLEGADFERLFEIFSKDAVRLEVRRSYGVLAEDKAYQRFIRGEDPGITWFIPWLDLMSRQTSQGKKVRRVRLIDTPPSDYLRFELWGTPYNLSAGEDIRYLERTFGFPEYDFWVFDSSILAQLEFDGADRFLGARITRDRAKVNAHVAHFTKAWDSALRFYEYADKFGPIAR